MCHKISWRLHGEMSSSTMIDNGVAGNEYDLSKATAKPGDPSFRAAETVSVVEEDCASMAAGDEAEHFWSSPEGSTVVEATVVSGLESMAREEIKEKLSLYGQTSRGRVWFTVPNDRLEEIWKLQSVDNLFVVMHRVHHAKFVEDEERDLNYLYGLVANLPWKKNIEVWRRVRAPEQNLDRIFAFEGQPPGQGASGCDLEGLPRFRVTCNRTGPNHKFTSMQTAAKVGAAINDAFRWKVDMKNFNLHIIVNICSKKVDFLIGLTATSLHHRNLIDFGPTSLRSTIAYNMLRLCRIRPSEIICDPLCGGGSIPIEAVRNFQRNFVIAADHHELAIPRCYKNFLHNKPVTNRAELLTWDSTRTPLRSKSIDVLVTDLPFGKRLGRKGDNRIFYPALLREFARISLAGKSRAILLTQDKRSLIKALQTTSRWWRQAYTIGCNVGGLEAAIFVCYRTSAEYYEI
ncbi:THUMP domain-containing protein 3-like isoform X1 [Varroa jacobsoni]|uniref:THUMP domain-containing protein 3-like isoform X1 n=2 Tax=Varroa jacobsoni TaxID=62625 RepID=UPI000BF38DF1|nr:THUMP domain-containing protein 3-like isoform X1 [Varroa jacobsoni]